MDNTENSAFEAFTTVTTGYYRSLDPGLAELALRHMLRLLADSNEDRLGRFEILCYLFCRIAQLSVEACEAFRSVLQDFQGPHAELAHGMLKAIKDPSFPNALDLRVQGPEELDLLWAEFFVTGSSDPILRIIETLDWEDRVRRHLGIWLQEKSFFGQLKRRATAATLRSVGLEVDLDAKLIITDGDLDYLCHSIAARSFPIFKHLPFQLSYEEAIAAMTKGTALWSLRLNSKEHQLVADLCHAEQKRPGGPTRLLLTEPSTEERPFAF